MMSERELLEKILENQTSMQAEFEVINKKLDGIFNKVGENSEELIKLNNSLEFLKLRQMDTEEQVHYLKKKIS